MHIIASDNKCDALEYKTLFPSKCVEKVVQISWMPI